MSKNKKLPVWAVLQSAWKYCCFKSQMSLGFSLIFYAIGACAVWSWQTWFFWPLMLVLYVVWGAFFRFYFDRKPYLSWQPLFNSLIPSTKIVLLTVLIATILVLLPLLPLFVNISPEFNAGYAQFLQGDIEHNGLFILGANVLFLLVSPIIAYRPFLAWISALIGRSGSLRLAWEKTRNNYWEFLVISLLTDCALSVVRWLILDWGGNDYITMLIAAPVMVYFNVVSALAYEFFFLDKKVNNDQIN